MDMTVTAGTQAFPGEAKDIPILKGRELKSDWQSIPQGTIAVSQAACL